VKTKGSTQAELGFIPALEDFILEKLGETRLPSVSLALLREGKVIYGRGLGLREIAHGRPATPRTLYGIGSVTKSFTCLAIMQLQEQGQLSVDDACDRYLPLEIRPGGEPIRLRHFMAHTSGIPALASSEAAIRHAQGSSDRWLPLGGYDDMLRFVNGAGDWTIGSPGERWFYLNEGYALLGAVIEKVSGRTYQDYVRDQILTPLGMTRSFFAKAEVEGDDDVAVPYLITKDKQQLPGQYLYRRVTSHGGLISSVEDMAAYVTMYLSQGEGPGGRVVSAESLRAMQAPAIPVPFRRADAQGDAPGGYYGFGLSINPDFFGRTLVGHGGSVLVSTAHMAFIPETDMGVVLLANGSGYPLAYLAQYALALMLGEDPWEIPALRMERRLERLTGTYETYKGTFGANIRRAGDFLVLEIRDRHTEQIVPLTPETFTGEVATFRTLAGGQYLPVEFRLTTEGIDLLYERYRFRRSGPLPQGDRGVEARTR